MIKKYFILLLALTITLAISGCSVFNSTVTAVIETPTEKVQIALGEDTTWQVLVIGDSSLWGFGDAYKKYIEQEVGVKVEVIDATTGGLPAGQVLEALETGKSTNYSLNNMIKVLPEVEVIVHVHKPHGIHR